MKMTRKEQLNLSLKILKKFEKRYKRGEVSLSKLREQEKAYRILKEITPQEIKRQRLSQQLNQEQFGSLLMVSNDTVSKWERDKQFPCASTGLLLLMYKDKPELLEEHSGALVAEYC